MNGSSKILTVSYGTFSCTLEGFDDPLGTMRDLAEYFRDLAADDRYFGAEPPTPDVEMLQNIAQREVRRKVEARTSPTGVALTQVEESAPAEETPEPSAPEATVAKKTSDDVSETGPLTFDDDFLMADEPEDILAVDPGAAPAHDGPAETVAEKLRRIRAVVSRRPNEDDASFNPAEALGASEKRERALSETIRQIQDDLSDDEDAGAPDAGTVQTAQAAATDQNLNEPAEAQPEAEEPELTETAIEDADDYDDYEDENDENADDDARSMSQFLENVSGKIGTTNEDEIAQPTKALADEKTDANVGRLLEETDNKLNEDGVVRRRQVISQMRAAVAATKADRAVTRLISPEVQDEAEKKAYRNDLSDAVATPAPKPPQKSERRPSTPPLVLVSSQRVSDNSGAQIGKTDQPALVQKSNGNSFAQFVEANDANGLEELLEAAAAYTIFSEGQESFSRPEIMKRVAMVDPALSLTREDGLRSFGQLLRQGKFQKLDRGQFTIDQETRFNPEKRIAGE